MLMGMFLLALHYTSNYSTFCFKALDKRSKYLNQIKYDCQKYSYYSVYNFHKK